MIAAILRRHPPATAVAPPATPATILDRTFPPDQCDPAVGDLWAAAVIARLRAWGETE